MKNIYFVNGFLESGKTTFIRELLNQKYFDTGEKTLLLVCEEGEETYSTSFCQKHHLILKMIESEEEFTEEKIRKLEQEVQPERIIVEFNGMWRVDGKMQQWAGDLVMEIVVIDAQCFGVYLDNLRSYIAQQVKGAYLTVFRSCDGVEKKLAAYRRSIWAMNPDTNFVFRNAEGETGSGLEEDLPYDINDEFIELDEESFGAFYIDAMQYVKRYAGKMVSYTGRILKKRRNMLLIGRQAMVCCMEDLRTFAFICDIADTDKWTEQQWVKVEGEIKEEYIEQMHASVPVIEITWIEPQAAPKQEIVMVN